MPILNQLAKSGALEHDEVQLLALEMASKDPHGVDSDALEVVS